MVSKRIGALVFSNLCVSKEFDIKLVLTLDITSTWLIKEKQCKYHLTCISVFINITYIIFHICNKCVFKTIFCLFNTLLNGFQIDKMLLSCNLHTRNGRRKVTTAILQCLEDVL